jgi:hypothetical protein
MRTPKQLYPQSSKTYTYELETCSICGCPLTQEEYTNGRKIVQTMESVMKIAYRPKRCLNPDCSGQGANLRSAGWQQIAPLYGTYGYDVIANIGWQRQTRHQNFNEVHGMLPKHVQISESQVRYLYTYQYLPLLACHERDSWEDIVHVSKKMGLILTLDGLAPEGGEPQLWLIRELRTGKTLRSGWMSEQSQVAFENFLKPIVEAELRVVAVMSDKQRGLLPAIKSIFPQAAHGYCHSHYLKNIAVPVATIDEAMKVSLRKQVRAEVGELIRPEQVEQPGVLTVTGLLPTPVNDVLLTKDVSEVVKDESLTATQVENVENIEETEDVKDRKEAQEGVKTEEEKQRALARQEQEEIETACKRRVRYLLTLKGRPPFRLAGVEMHERLREVSDCLGEMTVHMPTPCLTQLQQGIEQSLAAHQEDYLHVRQGFDWLRQISDLLAPEDKAVRTGEQVKGELQSHLRLMKQQSQGNDILTEFVKQIAKTTQNYQSGLFHTYDTPDLPRTNNERESEFRGLNQQLLRTTGQKGGTRRLIQRSGAWELIPRPDSLTATVTAIAAVDYDEYKKERIRVRSHRDRFRLHTRSVKQSRKQLQDLKDRWLRLPSGKPPG